MEWVANAIAVIFSVAGLIGWWRWMRSEMAGRDAPEVAGVKRGFFLSIAALFVLLAGAMIPIFVVSEDDMILGAGVGLGIILGGIVPVTIFMVLATTQFVSSEGREPVVLGPEARRSLRGPIAASIAGGFVVGTLTIWLVERSPGSYDPFWVMIAALALTLGLVLWPLLAIHACANRERAARAAKASRAPAAPR